MWCPPEEHQNFLRAFVRAAPCVHVFVTRGVCMHSALLHELTSTSHTTVVAATRCCVQVSTPIIGTMQHHRSLPQSVQHHLPQPSMPWPATIMPTAGLSPRVSCAVTSLQCVWPMMYLRSDVHEHARIEVGPPAQSFVRSLTPRVLPFTASPEPPNKTRSTANGQAHTNENHVHEELNSREQIALNDERTNDRRTDGRTDERTSAAMLCPVVRSRRTL